MRLGGEMKKRTYMQLSAKQLRGFYRGSLGIGKWPKEDVEKLYNKDPDFYDATTNLVGDLFYCMPDIWEHPLSWYFDYDEDDVESCLQRINEKLSNHVVVMLVEQGMLNKDQLIILENRGLLEKPRLKTLDGWYGAEKAFSPETIRILTEQ